MKKIRYCFFLIPFIFCFKVNAQQAPAPNELDNLYTPDKNSLFNSNSSTGSSGSSGGSSDMTLAFKFNPGFLIRNTAAVFTQYWLSDGIGLEGGLGYCYNKDNLMSLVSYSDMTLKETSSSLSLGEILERGNYSSGPNIFTSLSTRFYWSNYYNDNNYYFEIGTRYYNNTITIPPSSSDPNSSSYDYNVIKGNPRLSVRSWVFNMNYGLQFTTDGSVRTVHDFYLGFGVRSTSYNIFDMEERVVNNYGYSTSEYVHEKTVSRESVLVPVVLLGYVFGLGF